MEIQTENVSVTTVRLQTIIALADEIGSLSRKQLAAAARRRKLHKHSRARLHELTSGFADDVAALRLHTSRVLDLIEELNREQQTLRVVEQRPAEIAPRAGTWPS